MIIIFELLRMICVLGLSYISIMFFIGGISVLFADKNDYKYGVHRIFVAKTTN